jgi:spermidine synthase
MRHCWRLGGLKNITAVEINADLVDMMRSSPAQRRNLPATPATVVVMSRRFMRSRADAYDLIFLTCRRPTPAAA